MLPGLFFGSPALVEKEIMRAFTRARLRSTWVVKSGDKTIYSCSTLTIRARNADITTVEGIIGKDGGLHPVQKAFIEEIGPQCGICTPGQVVSAVTLLENNPKPTVDQVRHALSGNLCRCGAYDHYLKGVMKAAGRA